MSNFFKYGAILVLGTVIGVAGMKAMQPSSASHNMANEQPQAGEKKPLYWVAPMDANYRRDKPGKSPMGMELIPVYEENDSSDFGAGAVKIAPQVINNLGVRTATVTSDVMKTHIATVGYVQYDQDTLVHIHPRVNGWIEKLYIKAAGDPVAQGQPLYTLYSPQLVNAQEELMIALNRNNSRLIGAAKERLKALNLSQQFIDNLVKTRQVKQTITFFASQSGVVDGLKIREGFYVQPGNTLMSIGQLQQVWVEAEVFERDAGQIREGLAVTMTLDYLPAKQWTGTVDYVYPALDAKTRTLRVRLKFDNPDGELKPNMFAAVTIHADSEQATLMVPKESVIRTGAQNRVVLALGSGYFKSVEVNIGQVNDSYIEILSGVSEGDTVVTSAQFLIDSESSKTADFQRMSVDEKPESVWLQGTVENVMADHRMATIAHEPSEEWDWPAMTMNFTVDAKVDIHALATGQTLHFEVEKSGDNYLITTIHIIEQPSVASATVNGVINSIDSTTRLLNISRDAIEKWDRPAATMDFIADESLDLTALSSEQMVIFTFEIRDEFVIVDIQPHSRGND